MRFTIKQMQRVIETRNMLVFSHVTGIPPTPPGASRCTKCTLLETCATVSTLLEWQPPAADPAPALDTPVIAPEERAFFARLYQQLQHEGREIERQQAMLWNTPVSERIEQGSALGGLEPAAEANPNGQGEWQQTFSCTNTSELREGDEVLLSDGNPVTGEVVTGTILHISADSVTVWSPERIAHPRLIDRYDASIVHVRTLQNVLRWLRVDAHTRQLVAGTLRPRFQSPGVPPAPGLNEKQNLAVERALQMQDYLLIHGPPGTGKTSVIAAIVKQLCARGQRVLLAAFTNQAVDNMLRRLEREGFHDFVRLGHFRNVDESIAPHLLKQVLAQDGTAREGQAAGEERTGRTARELLASVPVFASTTATWSSDAYAPASAQEETRQPGDAFLHFDVAIIDEAGQLTIPAILGALRFAKRFILVGDEKQLPPLVLSQDAAGHGLKDSLFSQLKQADTDYMNNHPQEMSACVPLNVQYRMNTWISHFASKVFYDGLLKPDATVARRLLEYATPPGMQEMQGMDAREQRSKRSREASAITRALDPGMPFVFLDVQDDEGERNGVKVSDAEARAVRELVAGLLARGVEGADIGIIAPYKAQVANVRRYLFSDDRGTSGTGETGWRALSRDTQLTVDTVDRFQGGERSVMILTFATVTAPVEDSQLWKHLTDPHRLNVALTRAQRKIIFVGHAPALEGLPYFKRLLNYCRQMQAVVLHHALVMPR